MAIDKKTRDGILRDHKITTGQIDPVESLLHLILVELKKIREGIEHQNIN